MSFSYGRYEHQSRRRPGSHSRTAYGYWIPLGFTILVGTIGLATWAWKERRDNPDVDDDEPGDKSDESGQYGLDRPPSSQSHLVAGETSYRQDQVEESIEVNSDQQNTFMEKMSKTVRNAPGPQQLYDGASRQVAAGVAAAGAVLGRGLSSTKEEKDDFRDHRTWSEEAETREREDTAISRSTGSFARGERRDLAKDKRKMVVVVVSSDAADAPEHGAEEEEEAERRHISHASILSQLPLQVDPSLTQLLVLIYAPHLQVHPLTAARTSHAGLQRSSSTGSSFSNISSPGLQTGDDFAESEAVKNPYNPLYGALNTQAQALVNHATHVLPYTTPTGHIHLLRHLSPSTVYMQESVSGKTGEHVQQIVGWVGQTVLVIGGDGINGGLVDPETVSENAYPLKQSQKWWANDRKVGLGKGIQVVEVGKIREDWAKRIGS